MTKKYQTTVQPTRLLAILVFALTLMPQIVFAQTATTFTYQAELKQNGNPANGPYNMEFELQDSSGTPLGTNTINGVQVVDGRFTVELDFGAADFNLWHQTRWLEIKVNGNTLVPRSLISRSPYALQTRGIRVNDDASFVGIGRDTPLTSSEVFGLYKNTSGFAGMYVATENGGSPFYGYSTAGSVDAYHYFDGSTGKWHFVNSSGVPMTITDEGHVGIGTSNPRNHFLDVVASSPGPPLVSALNTGLGGGVFAICGNGRAIDGWASGNTGVNYGVSGQTSSFASGFGVYSIGNMGASGVKSFRIDHPHEPTEKYLLHYSAESPQVINFYSGSTTVDNRGEATIELPDYFDKINKDPRYFLTAVGAPMPNLHIAQEIDMSSATSSFRIAGGAPGAKVCWEVKAVRDDLWMRTHGAPVEVAKSYPEQGIFQHPELYGLPPITFDRDKDHGGYHDVGMIAEEVSGVPPEIATYEENGIDASAMDYSKLTPLFVEAPNALRAEQDSEIASIRAENDSLRAEKDAQINALQTEVADLRDIVVKLLNTMETSR